MNRNTRRHHYLVTYDISDDRKRTEVFETCRDFGNHVQYSVFLCELDRREMVTLREQVRGTIQHTTDQVLFVDLGPATQPILEHLEVLGKPYSPPERSFVI